MGWIPRSLVRIVILAAVTAPLLVRADVPSDEQEPNRLLVEKWRADPNRWARLQHDLDVFRAQSPRRKAQLRQLDHDLHTPTGNRLRPVLDRYAHWLARLPAEDRQLILDAPDARGRLKVVRRVKERQWLARLPEAVQQRLQTMRETERSAFIQQLRREERQRRQEWQATVRHWDEVVLLRRPFPARLSEFPDDVQKYVTQKLMGRLTKEERERLANAEGKWPLYPITLVELADAHPEAAAPGPAKITDLPPEMQRRLQQRALKNPWQVKPLKRKEGKWPEFAQELATMKYIAPLPPGLAPTRPEHLPKPVQKFLFARLLPVLTDGEKDELDGAEGQWPDYPRVLHALAKKHGLIVPGTSLPGRPEVWDKYRFR